MAWLGGPTITVPGIVAGADLRTHQYKFVKINSSGKAILASVAGEEVIGVLQNKPNTDEACEIVAIGVTPVIAGAAVTNGDKIMTNASAQGITSATAGSKRVGTALEAASGAAVEFTAWVNCGAGVV